MIHSGLSNLQTPRQLQWPRRRDGEAPSAVLPPLPRRAGAGVKEGGGTLSFGGEGGDKGVGEVEGG